MTPEALEPPLDEEQPSKPIPARAPQASGESARQAALRRARTNLSQAVGNLSRIRDLAPARDALKLVRQAQNLVDDAEEIAG